MGARAFVLAIGVATALVLPVPDPAARGAPSPPSPVAGDESVDADFNGDGYGDLAIGAPLEDVGEIVDAGGVNVIYGSSTGLSATATPDQFWTQDSPSVQNVAEEGDKFGIAAAGADFNGDGYSDLAVGVLLEDNASGVVDAGAVNVIYGSSTGLSATAIPDQFWTQNSPDVEDVVEEYDHFGWALAAADFNADGFADLAIGVPGEAVGVLVQAGGVNVIYGSSSGLSATAIPDQFWTQDSPDVEGVAELGEGFGMPLAAANFGGSSHADLAIGVPGDDVGTIDQAGAVNVIYGSSSGLSATSTPDQIWHQDSPDVEGVAEAYDEFGDALAAANFGGSSHADLAIGVPQEWVGEIDYAGGVNVIYGSSSGLSATATPDQFWSQDSADVNGVSEATDSFGSSLAAANFGGGFHADLAIGVRGEGVGDVDNCGGVNVIYGSSIGLSATATPDQFWYQDSTDIDDVAEYQDLFGWALAAANFGGTSQAELAIGILYEDVAYDGDGAVSVIYGSGSGLSATATPDQFWYQDSPDVEDAAEAGDAFGWALAAVK